MKRRAGVVGLRVDELESEGRREIFEEGQALSERHRLQDEAVFVDEPEAGEGLREGGATQTSAASPMPSPGWRRSSKRTGLRTDARCVRCRARDQRNSTPSLQRQSANARNEELKRAESLLSSGVRAARIERL